MSRADAATAAGMERQALRDAVVRFNAEGPEGARDRPLPGRPPALSEAELALLLDRIIHGPDPETDGVSAWALPDLRRWIEARFDKRLSPQSLSVRARSRTGGGLAPTLRREGFSRQKTRPVHPKTDEAAQRRFEEGAPRGAERRRRSSSWQADHLVVPG